MISLSNFLLLGCFIFLLLLGLIRSDLLHDPSLQGVRHEFTKTVKQPYLFDRDNSSLPFYNYYGDTEITPGSVRLTPAASGKQGSVWSKTPNDLNEWAAVLGIRIKGNSPVLGSEGMAFWYTSEPGVLGPIFGSKDRWNGLGVFLDSHDNDKKNNNPAILAVYNSGNYDYPFHEDGMHHSFGHCFREYRNSYMPFLLKLLYSNRTLTVEYDADGHGYAFKKCFEYSPIHLAKGSYFGVSASTGEIPDSHELISLDIYELNSPLVTVVPLFGKKEPDPLERKHEEFQNRLHDIVHKKEADEIKNSRVDMVFLEKMIRKIEEGQESLREDFYEFIGRPAAAAAGAGNVMSDESLKQLGNKISSIERQLTGVSNSLSLISDSLSQMAGQHHGNKALMDQLAQLNQMTHNKLNFIEESSKKSNEKVEEFHFNLQEKEKSNLWWYLTLIILQVLVVIWLALNWKHIRGGSSHSSSNKKFI